MNVINVVFVTADDEMCSCSAWDADTGTLVSQYRPGGSSQPCGLSISGGYLFTCSKGKPFLNSWPLNKQHADNKRLIAPGKISAFDYSPDGVHAAVAVEEKIHLYQTASGRLLGIGTCHFQPISVVKCNSDSTLIGCGGEDGMVTVWNIGNLAALNNVNRDPECSFSQHSLPVHDLCFSSGNSRVFSVSLDRTCKVFDLIGKTMLLSVVFSARLTAVSLLPSESSAFVGDSDGFIKQINLHDPPRGVDHHLDSSDVPVFHGHQKQVTALTCSTCCVYLISGSTDHSVRIWHVSSRQCLRTLTHKGPVTNLLYRTLHKSMFTPSFKPSLIPRPFVNQESDENNELILEIKTQTDVVACKRDWNLKSYLPSRNEDKQIERSKEVDKLKLINSRLYKFTLKKILHKKVSDQSELGPKQKKRKKY